VSRRDRWAYLAVGLGLLGLYLATLCPTIYSGDAAELATAGATFGIPHPPGYPLFSLLGNIWSHLLPLGEAAWRINLLSALAGCGAALLVMGLVMRLEHSRLAGVAAALGLGLGLSFWSQALISEVYAFDMFLAAATLFTAIRARQRGDLGSSALALACVALWIGHRNINLIYAPAVVLLLGRSLLRHVLAGPRAVALLGGMLLLPVLALLYLPLASAADPLLDTGDPETWPRLWEVVTAKVYRQYLFAGDWWKNLALLLAGLPREWGAALALAPLGALYGWRRRRTVTLSLVYLVGANLLFAASYGVPDVSVFLLPAVLAGWVLAGLGLSDLMRLIPAPANRAIGTVLALACAAPLAALNLPANNLRGQTLARDFARDALAFPAKNGLVMSHVDSVSFSLYYGQAVEGLRPDLLVVSRGRAVDWHQEQARRLRPDLDIPLYDGPNAISRWPTLLTMRNVHRVAIYVTANLAGYFAPPDAAQLGSRIVELPAGLMTRLALSTSAPNPAQVIRRNRAFWIRAWPHARAARDQRLSTDMTALLLHYASMRVLFAKFCLLQGDPRAAAQAARDVVELDTAPLIAGVNQDFARSGGRYHMSQMPQIANDLEALALQQGRTTLDRVRQRLGQGIKRPDTPRPQDAPPPSDRPSPAAAEPPEVKALNMEGIRLAQQGSLPAALRNFEQVLMAAPAHVGALFNRAKVLALLGRPAQAVTAYEGLLQRSPAHLPGLLGLAELHQQRSPGKAAQLYQRALAAPGPEQLRALARQRLQLLTSPP